MIKRSHGWILLLDFLAISSVVLLLCRFVNAGAPGSYWHTLLVHGPLWAAAIVIWIAVYYKLRLDGFRGGWHLPAIVAQVVVAVAVLMFVLLALAFMTRQFYSRLFLLYFAAGVTVAVISVRCFARFLVLSRSRVRGLRRVVIIGNGNVARELERKITRHPELMYDLVGFIYPSGSDAVPVAPTPGVENVQTLGILDLLRRHDVQELIVVLAQSAVDETRKLIETCRGDGIRVTLVPQSYELYGSRMSLFELDGLPLLTIREHSPSRLNRALKRTMDLVLGLLMFLVVLPWMALSAAVLLINKGKGLRTEVRCGRNGREFRMLRLNVDRDHPDLGGHERFLSQLSLTELPQLWNVLRGEMSLVGPRPEAPERVRHYSEWQKRRLTVKPGLTGLAQVMGLREQHSSEEKARFDLQYILHASLLFDLSLILQTVWTLAVRNRMPSLKHAAPASSGDSGKPIIGAPVNADST